MRPRAAQQLQQHRLRLIVGVMRQRDHVDVLREQTLVARVAGERLETAAAAARDLDAMQHERKLARGALGRAELRPAVGVRREPVMDMNRGERDCMARCERCHGVEQYHRIEAARKRHGHARARLYVPGQRGADGRVHGE